MKNKKISLTIILITIFFSNFFQNVAHASYFYSGGHSVWDDASNSTKENDFSMLSQSIHEDQYILRYWPSSINIDYDKSLALPSPGHISIETKECYLDVWPEKSAGIKTTALGKKIAIRLKKFPKNTLHAEKFLKYCMKVVQLTKATIDEMNKECRRIGCYDKKAGCIVKGIKDYWQLDAAMDANDDDTFGSCATCTYQVLKKSNIQRKGMLRACTEYFTGSSAALWLGCNAPAALASASCPPAIAAYSGYVIGGALLAGLLAHSKTCEPIAINDRYKMTPQVCLPSFIYNAKVPNEKILFSFSNKLNKSQEEIKHSELKALIKSLIRYKS